MEGGKKKKRVTRDAIEHVGFPRRDYRATIARPFPYRLAPIEISQSRAECRRAQKLGRDRERDRAEIPDRISPRRSTLSNPRGDLRGRSGGGADGAIARVAMITGRLNSSRFSSDAPRAYVDNKGEPGVSEERRSPWGFSTSARACASCRRKQHKRVPPVGLSRLSPLTSRAVSLCPASFEEPPAKESSSP